jgi:hypothetical protein
MAFAERIKDAARHRNILSEDEMLSWIEEPPPRLEIMEAFYIGALRPERNLRRSEKDELRAFDPQSP